MRIGIFGGSFNPPHFGHVSSMQTVQKKLGLDEIYVLPNNLNPLKAQVEGPSAEQRLQMIELAVKDMGPRFKIDNQEILRGGKSYTIDTILKYRKKFAAEDIFLIVGIDNLENFDQWKDYRKILSECNLVVTTRPGFDLPTTKEELRPFLLDLVEEYEFNYVELKTGRNIQFISLQNVDVSSSELRKMVRAKKSLSQYVPLAVEQYISEKNLYRSIGEKIKDYEKFTQFCANSLSDKKAIGIKAYDLRSMSAPAEFTLVAAGTSTRHAIALSEQVVKTAKEEFGIFPQGIEGNDEGRWVVLDYGSLIVHIFYDFVRNEYRLEDLWKNVPQIKL